MGWYWESRNLYDFLLNSFVSTARQTVSRMDSSNTLKNCTHIEYWESLRKHLLGTKVIPKKFKEIHANFIFLKKIKTDTKKNDKATSNPLGFSCTDNALILIEFRSDLGLPHTKTGTQNLSHYHLICKKQVRMIDLETKISEHFQDCMVFSSSTCGQMKKVHHVHIQSLSHDSTHTSP